MSPERYPSDDPREWLNRAKSNLALAKGAANISEVFFEDLCFDCQQAAEKSLKALLVLKKLPVPRTHDIAELLTLVQKAGFAPSAKILESAMLTGFSVASRYPGSDEPVTEEEFREALSVAEFVVEWVSDLLLHQ